MASTLIVDDEPSVRNRLAARLRHRGHHIVTAADAAEALARLSGAAYDVVLVAVETVAAARLSLLREIVRRHRAAVILATIQPTVAEAVEAIRIGAYDYLAKPLSVEQVDGILRRASRARMARGSSALLAPDPPPLLTSANPAMAYAIATAQQVASIDATVLLHGASGTGRHVFAAAIHGWSPRRERPLVNVGSTTVVKQARGPRRAIEASLVARTIDKRGSPGLQEGTLFVEDLENLAATLGANLPRLLLEHRLGGSGSEAVEIAARIIAATECRPDTPGWHFGEILRSRSEIVSITLPLLRERPEDLPALTDHLLARLVVRHRRGPLRLKDEVRVIFSRYPWPGNVRELSTVLERAVVLCRGDTIGVDDLPDLLLRPAPSAAPAGDSKSLSLAELERQHIQLVVTSSASIREAATRLGIDQATLWRKRKRYGLGTRRD